MNDQSDRTHDVFISYSDRDRKIAQTVCALLEQQGIRCWVAYRDIPAGENWPERIMRAIKESRVLVLILSSESNASNQVFREVTNALESSVTVIPFKISNVETSERLKFYLADINWMDAVTEPIEQHIKALASQIEVIVEKTDGRINPPGGGPREPKRPGSSNRWKTMVWILTIVLVGGLLAGLVRWQARLSGISSSRPSIEGKAEVPTSTSQATLPTAAKMTPAGREEKRIALIGYLDSIKDKLETGISKDELANGRLREMEDKISEFDIAHENAGDDQRCTAAWKLFLVGELLIRKYDVRPFGWAYVKKAGSVMSDLTCPDKDAWMKWWVFHGTANLMNDYKMDGGNQEAIEKYWKDAMGALPRDASGKPQFEFTTIYTTITLIQMASFYRDVKKDTVKASESLAEALSLCNANLESQKKDAGYKAWCEGASNAAASLGASH